MLKTLKNITVGVAAVALISGVAVGAATVGLVYGTGCAVVGITKLGITLAKATKENN